LAELPGSSLRASAKQSILGAGEGWIASSLALLAMTVEGSVLSVRSAVLRGVGHSLHERAQEIALEPKNRAEFAQLAAAKGMFAGILGGSRLPGFGARPRRFGPWPVAAAQRRLFRPRLGRPVSHGVYSRKLFLICQRYISKIVMPAKAGIQFCMGRLGIKLAIKPKDFLLSHWLCLRLFHSAFASDAFLSFSQFLFSRAIYNIHLPTATFPQPTIALIY